PPRAPSRSGSRDDLASAGRAFRVGPSVSRYDPAQDLMTRARRSQLAILSVAVLALLLCVTPTSRPASEALPERLDDRIFWTLVTEFSEPNGFFRSDNLVSNETVFQHVIPTLPQTLGPVSAYVGVGPDQNFTYIAGLKPRIAFIVDIRRGNLLLHLMYKALIELAPTRQEF